MQFITPAEMGLSISAKAFHLHNFHRQLLVLKVSLHHRVKSLHDMIHLKTKLWWSLRWAMRSQLKSSRVLWARSILYMEMKITFSDYHLYNSSNSTLQLGNKEIKMFRKKNNPNSLIKNQDYWKEDIYRLKLDVCTLAMWYSLCHLEMI